MLCQILIISHPNSRDETSRTRSERIWPCGNFWRSYHTGSTSGPLPSSQTLGLRHPLNFIRLRQIVKLSEAAKHWGTIQDQLLQIPIEPIPLGLIEMFRTITSTSLSRRKSNVSQSSNAATGFVAEREAKALVELKNLCRKYSVTWPKSDLVKWDTTDDISEDSNLL